MANAPRRYPLIVYREVINRWWPEVFVLGLFLCVLSWPVYQSAEGQAESWRWMGLLGLGGVAMIFALFLLFLRNMAYVQVFPTHVRLVTPLLRFNISLKRVLRSTTAEMRALFPPSKVRGWQRKVVAPLAGKTAVVLELNGWPVSPHLLRVFLSRFFFKDQSTHFVILVEDWMRFSTELESRRTAGVTAKAQPAQHPLEQSILSRLPRKEQ